MTNERTKQPKHVKNISRSLQAGSNKVHYSTPLSLLSFSKCFTQKYRIINVSSALVICVFCAVLCRCLCTGHFVRSPLNLTCLHCLQPSFFEHLFYLYCSCKVMLRQKMSNEKKAPLALIVGNAFWSRRTINGYMETIIKRSMFKSGMFDLMWFGQMVCGNWLKAFKIDLYTLDLWPSELQRIRDLILTSNNKQTMHECSMCK